MKKSRLSYDEWKCIISKDIFGKIVNTDLLNGYIGLIDIKEVSKIQTWKFNGEDVVVCDKGRKWLSILPQNDWYCITAMMNEDGEILLWYIDMIASQGIDADGVPYFDDLYLDLVVYPNGTIIVDDMDELEEALSKKDITQEQFNLAVETSQRLQSGMLSNVSSFIEYTKRCYEMITKLPERLDRKVIYESDYVCLYADKVRLSNGYIIENYHQIHYPHEAISIVVFNENDEVLLIQSKRYTVMRLEWEIPAGRIENGESKEDAARRECMEETGCTVKDLKFLCTQNPSNGMSDCICHVFAARVDTESMDFDENEVQMKKWVSRDKVLQMLKDNETKDGVSILALLFAFEFYK